MLGALFASWIEYLRRPRLKISAEPQPVDVEFGDGFPAKRGRYVRVLVYNRPNHWLVRWMIVRAPAQQCRAFISFHHPMSSDVFGRSMQGRWARDEQPVKSDILNLNGEKVFELVNIAALIIRSRKDIYAGEREILDIALRADEDDECYGWNDESYASIPAWRNPRWRLPSGRYVIKVSVQESGRNHVGYFRLMNNDRRVDFRLEAASHHEIRNVKRYAG